MSKTKQDVSEHTFSEKWPLRHRDMEDKWHIIRFKVMEKQPFDGPKGWRDVSNISGHDGYCQEFQRRVPDNHECDDCPLYKDGYCGYQDGDEVPVLWDFIDTMKGPDGYTRHPDFDRALELAADMHERIKRDRPL